MKNQKGENVFTINFYNCRFTNIGQITLSTQGDETYNTLNVSLRFDYFKIENLKDLSRRYENAIHNYYGEAKVNMYRDEGEALNEAIEKLSKMTEGTE